MPDPLPKYAKVSATNPEAFAQCDRCGFWYQRTDLVWQDAWAGTHLYVTGALVCTTGNNCYDIPNEQLRTIILPPDPPPVLNARVPNYAYEEQTARIIQWSATVPPVGPNKASQPPWAAGPQMIRCTQDGLTARVIQYTTSS